MEKAYLYIANIADLQLEILLEDLSAERRAYVLRCRDVQTQKQRAASVHLCAYALRELGADIQMPLEFSKQENGKPFLADCPWQFNLSHSGDVICCALSDTMRIGTDVQQMTERNFVHLAKRFCSENEYVRLMRYGEDTLKSRFYEFWVRKEALSKRDGAGLNKDFRTVDVTKWHVCCFERDNYMFAVATDNAFELVVRNVTENWL